MGFSEGFVSGSILKLDVEKKEFVSTWIDPKCLATEPMFVPRPGSTGKNKTFGSKFYHQVAIVLIFVFLTLLLPPRKGTSRDRKIN